MIRQNFLNFSKIRLKFVKASMSTFRVSSDNSFYYSYEIECADVLEILEYECSSINKDDLGLLNPVPVEIHSMFLSLKKDIQILKDSLKNNR